MKTTIDIKDDLLNGAKRLARRTGQPLRAIVEEGLRRVLTEPREKSDYRLPDCSVGDKNAPDPLESMSWQDLRAEIYGERSPR